LEKACLLFFVSMLPLGFRFLSKAKI